MLDVVLIKFALVQFARIEFARVGFADGAAKVPATSCCCRAAIAT